MSAAIAPADNNVPENTTGSSILNPVELLTVIRFVPLAVAVAVCVTVVGVHANWNVNGMNTLLVNADSKL